MNESIGGAGSNLEITREGRVGVIALNRPAAINALTLDMVRAIAEQLNRWRNDPNVRVVLFEGHGPKGFCSGGDVRAVREAILAGDAEEGQRFFAEEYAMNGQIAGYSKPVVALCDGVVMGGGIGIAGHADFRFATSSARFAMPESAIGFFCDVGSNAILARAPLHRALLFLMTGQPVGAADALALGLTDCVVAPERLAEVRRGVVAAAESADPETALVRLMQGQGIEPGDPTLCIEADLCQQEMLGGDAATIVAAIGLTANAISPLRRISQLLQSRCPTSLEAIVQSQLAARRLGNLEAVLAIDLALAGFMSRRADFAEGVKAVLIDKAPAGVQWSPPAFDAAVAAEITATIASVSPTSVAAP